MCSKSGWRHGRWPSGEAPLLGKGCNTQLEPSQAFEILHSSTATRTASPGLRAGARLALQGYEPSPAEVAAEARSACRQVSQRNRGTCPFDDHSAFGASAADREAQPRHAPMATADARRTHQEAHELRRNNRQAQQKIGVGTPWDAPEPATVARASCCQAAQQAALAAGGSDARAAVHHEAMAEAKRYRERMHGSQDLIAGNYWLGDGLAAARNQALPAPGKVLMPGAHMKLQYDGGSLQTLTHERAEYLNSRILAENNRARNEAALQLS